LNIIHLQPALMQQLEQAAIEQKAEPEQLVETAIRAYLRQLDRDRIRAEAEAYRSLHTELTKKYVDQYVAIHNGRLVDNDKDFQAIHGRIRQRFGNQPVLIRLVEAQPERELVFRSPRVEQRPL